MWALWWENSFKLSFLGPTSRNERRELHGEECEVSTHPDTRCWNATDSDAWQPKLFSSQPLKRRAFSVLLCFSPSWQKSCFFFCLSSPSPPRRPRDSRSKKEFKSSYFKESVSNLTNLFAASCTPTEQSGCDTNWEGAEGLEGIPILCFYVCVFCNTGLFLGGRHTHKPDSRIRITDIICQSHKSIKSSVLSFIVLLIQSRLLVYMGVCMCVQVSVCSSVCVYSTSMHSDKPFTFCASLWRATAWKERCGLSASAASWQWNKLRWSVCGLQLSSVSTHTQWQLQDVRA